MRVLASITDRILTLPGWLVLALVVAFPALEASAFVGFVFPGEIAASAGLSRHRDGFRCGRSSRPPSPAREVAYESIPPPCGG